MTNVIRLSELKRSKEQVRDQAGVYLARLDAGASPEELRQIEDWLRESPLHREVLLDMAALWDELTVLSSLSEVFPLDEYSPRAAPARLGYWKWAAAACAVVFAASTLWLLSGNPATQDRLAATDAQTVHRHYATAIGKQSTVSLPDGSEIILNTNTDIDVVYTPGARNIFLHKGEGYFSVAKNKARPFRVYAGKRMVEAVGTAFTVQHTDPQNVQVVVREGKVNFLPLRDTMDADTLPQDLDKVFDRNDSVFLVAGDQAAVGSDSADEVEMSQIQPDEIEVRLAWTHGMLLFQGDSVANVIKEMSRYTTMKIEAEEAVKDIQVDGYYRAGDIDSLLIGLRKNLKIESRKTGDNHILLYAGK